MAAPRSALAAALDRIGDRWSLLLVDALMDGPMRFADLQQAVGIASNVLTARLRQLEEGGVVLAAPYSNRPARYSYELTAAGRDLAGAARLLAQWSADHGGGPGDGRPGRGGGTPAHAACGTPMEARWWCPTCDQPGDGSEAPIWI